MVRRRSTEVAMMRIAIAGAGGFANILARELSQSAHALLVLSTKEHPEFEEFDCQVAVVNYNDIESLRFTLQGVDLVISTISGAEQMNLIDAARRARIRRFVPSEFEGAIGHRPEGNDPLDNDASTARGLLDQWSRSQHYPIRSTVFSCGVFYERFAPGGLEAYNMGASWWLRSQGSYMMNLGTGTGDIPIADSRGHPVSLVLTSVFDVARFLAAAVELGIDNWPPEFKIIGARLTTERLRQICSEDRRMYFQVNSRPYHEIEGWLNYFEENPDAEKWWFMQHLLQTANGRYTFNAPNFDLVPGFQPMGFREWLREVWGPAQ